MSSTNQQQKDTGSSNSTQPSLSNSTASGSNNCAKMEEKASHSKKARGPRAGAKRNAYDAPGHKQQQRQLIRYNRDALLQMRDSRLSSAWPRALDRAYVGDGGLWDPVKLFEEERKNVFEGKTKIERVRNVRGGVIQQSYSSGPSAEDSNSFGRSSRRRKRTKEEAASPAVASSAHRQRGWPSEASSAQQPPKLESAKDSRKEPQQQQRDEVVRGFGQQRPGPTGGGFARRLERPSAAGGGAGSSRGGLGGSGQWERSQGLRTDQPAGRSFQPPRHRPAGEEEMPAWFDEGPLDKLEKLELTGLPEDMEAAEGDGGSRQQAAADAQQQQQQQQPQQPEQPEKALGDLLRGAGSDVGSASSRFAKWLSADEPQQPQHGGARGERSGAQQHLERIFQDMRSRRGPDAKQPEEAPAASTVGPSLMHLLRPPQTSQQPPRPLHAQEVEASLKSLLFGSERSAPPPAAPAAAAAAAAGGPAGGSGLPVLPPNGQARTLEEIENSLGAASSGSDRSSGGSKDSRAIYKLIGELQVQMHDAAGGSVGGRQASVPPLLASSRQAGAPAQQPQPQPQPQSRPLQPTAAPFIAQNPLPPRSQPPPPPPQQPPTAPPMFPSGGAASQAAASAAAQRRLPMPLQAQQLQQLQAMLLSNLQMQAQMMHSGQMSAGSANKANPLNKLLPQQLFYRPQNPFLLRNNALQGTRLLNQHFNQTAASDMAAFEAAAGVDASAALRRPAASAGAAAAASGQQPIAQPAMPIVPPMLLPPKTSSASSAASAASLQGWGGAHNQQLSAMLWNASRLAASVKSANSSAGWALHRSPPVDSGVGQPHRPTAAKPVDEMPSA